MYLSQICSTFCTFLLDFLYFLCYNKVKIQVRELFKKQGLNKEQRDDNFMHSTLVSGDTTELRCQLAFTERDFDTYKPTRASSKADLVADINGKLVKIQCKAASPFKNSDDSFKIFSSYRTFASDGKRVKNKYTKDEIDFFYTHYKGYDFLIPVEDTDTVEKILRITAPKNGQYESVSAASDYLMDNVIESIINNTPIKKFSNNYIVSTDVNTNEEIEWNTSDFQEVYTERQRRNIKESISKKTKAYGKYWSTKAFPELHITNYNVA